MLGLPAGLAVKKPIRGILAAGWASVASGRNARPSARSASTDSRLFIRSPQAVRKLVTGLTVSGFTAFAVAADAKTAKRGRTSRSSVASPRQRCQRPLNSGPMAYTFQFRDVFAQKNAIVDGLVLTLELSVGTILLGFILGVLVATVLVYGKPWARKAAGVYVEAIRNTPLIVQLFLIFFGLPNLGLKLDAITASVIALTINLGAYTAEIVRAGFESIPRSQIEAGVSLGMTGPQVFRHVVLLPALKNVYPSLT